MEKNMNEIHTIQLTTEELKQLKEILSKTYEQAKDNWDIAKVQSAKSLLKKLDNDKHKK